MSQMKKIKSPLGYTQDDFNIAFNASNEFYNQDTDQDINQDTDQDNNTNQDTDQDTNTDQDNKTCKNNYQNNYEDLGINIKNLFFEILEMLANGENPIPYVMDNQQRQFTFSIMILIIGGLLLFFSNLMIE